MVCFYSVNVAIQKAGVATSLTPNAGNPIEFVQVNNLTFNQQLTAFMKFKTDATVVYDPSFQGVYSVSVQYRWNESWYPAPIVVDFSFVVTIIDPCVTELTTPLTFADQTLTYGDPDTTLDLSVAISNSIYDFCAYTIVWNSWQA
jgi:hypothetical protein